MEKKTKRRLGRAREQWSRRYTNNNNNNTVERAKRREKKEYKHARCIEVAQNNNIYYKTAK